MDIVKRRTVMNDDQPESLGEFLRKLREDAGLSVRQLAGRVGVHHSYVARFETGERKPSIALLQRIADVLHTDSSALLTYIGVRPSPTLPPLREYFPRKYGVSANEANMLANLVEYQLRKQKGEDGTATDEPRNKGPD
jgi:transcriptional regulator with XRE-family HTH domain